MLVPYTPVSELSEEQKKKLKSQAQIKSGFVVVDGKVVSTNELRGLQASTEKVRQNLFETSI